jgi:Lar family restriction alleviation protein
MSTKTLTPEELKPCPFCSKSDVTTQLTEDPGYESLWSVYCRDCGAEGESSSTKSHAVKMWNTRPIEDKLRGELETMKEAYRIVSRTNDENATVAELKILNQADSIAQSEGGGKMKRNWKGWFKINSNRNSECGSGRLRDLDWANAYTDTGFEDLYLHVHRISDDTYHRVFPRRKNVTGIGWRRLDPNNPIGTFFWIVSHSPEGGKK